MRVIATTRESLGLPGEHTLGVPSLRIESDDGSLPHASRLFVDRAAAVRPGFDPSEPELDEIDRISRRIDGIPLGLELAAARLRSMSTGELAGRLEDSFVILSGSAKTALPRQRTLHATIEWSYDLLESEEQTFFRRLSVFAGGFDLRAAEAVTPGDDVDEYAVLDHLDSLTDKSLVVASDGGSVGTRYRLLEPVRQFAQEVMSRTGAGGEVRARHADYFRELVRETAPGIRTPAIVAAQRTIKRDYENVRAALGTLMESCRLDDYLRLSFDLFLYWMHEGLQVEGIDLAVPGFEHPGGDRLLRVKSAYAASVLAAELTRPAGIDYARTGLALAHELDDPNAVGRMELALGAAIRHATTDPEYLEHLVRGRQLLEAHPEPHWSDPEWDRGIIQVLLAAYLPPEDERLEEHIEAALSAMESYGDMAMFGAILSDAAGYFYLYGDRQRGLDAAARAHEIYEGLESPNWQGHVIQTRASLARFEEDDDGAIELFRRSAALLEGVGDVNCWAHSTRTMAVCLARRGDTSEAAQLMLNVMERLEILPMMDTHQARVLDATADVLLSAGEAAAGSRMLGAALAAPFPSATSVIRPTELQHVETRARELDLDADSHIAAGRELVVSDALERARTALQSLVG